MDIARGFSIRVFFRYLLVVAISSACLLCAWKALIPGSPEISVRHPLVDLGVIDSKNDQRKVAFQVLNKGKAELRINRIKVSCPCLEPQLERSILAPGEKTELTVLFSPPSSPGKWEDTILLFSNDPDNQVTKLTFRAFIRLVSTVKPSRLFVSSLRPGESQQVGLTVYGPTDDVLFRILDASAGSSAISLLEIYDGGEVPDNNRKVWKVLLSVKSRGLASWKDKICICTTDEKMASIEVPISIHECQDIEFKPRMICLNNDPDGGESSRIIEITSNAANPSLEYTTLEVPKWISVQEIDAKAGLPNRLCFRVCPSKPLHNGSYQGEIRVFLTERSLPLRIPVLLFCRIADQ